MSKRKHKPIPQLAIKDIERFWSSVQVGLSDECWLWLPYKDRNGYGQFGLQHSMFRPNRLSYFIHYGIDPLERCVCHNCPGKDNPSCVNPAHLWLGTRLENNMDFLNKGGKRIRRKSSYPNIPRGELNFKARLTRSEVLEIRSRYTGQRGDLVILAKEYGVTKMSIWHIVNRNTWKHV